MAVALVAFAASFTFVSVGLAPETSAAEAPVRRYIVVLEGAVANSAITAAQHAAALDLDVTHVYSHALNGYAASVPAASLTQLRATPGVRFIERVQTMRASATQNNATWGLDRIDQRSCR